MNWQDLLRKPLPEQDIFLKMSSEHFPDPSLYYKGGGTDLLTFDSDFEEIRSPGQKLMRPLLSKKKFLELMIKLFL